MPPSTVFLASCAVPPPAPAACVCRRGPRIRVFADARHSKKRQKKRAFLNGCFKKAAPFERNKKARLAGAVQKARLLNRVQKASIDQLRSSGAIDVSFARITVQAQLKLLVLHFGSVVMD